MKTGTVAIIGRPNVGKSTLLNAIIGEKISIVSKRPSTTRFKIIGNRTTDNYQILFIDTPGFDEPRTRLDETLVSNIYSAIKETDIILFLIESKGWINKDEEILQSIKKIRNKPVLLGINKIDLMPDYKQILPLIDISNKKFKFSEIMPFSALIKTNVSEIEKAIIKYLPEGEMLLPAEDTTSLSREYEIVEIIREKVFEATYQEVPHSVAVELEDIQKGNKNPDMLVVKANIIVERPNQKKIIIGENGEKIKNIGIKAREELEFFTGQKVYLQLKVQVIEDWRNRPDVYRRFGYTGANIY
ncbi:MAG: GTPase Era [Candidatus Omnitrophica bacterium]|nr:GTPase Era [Candidatus Omnitrophota bacterium]